MKLHSTRRLARTTLVFALPLAFLALFPGPSKADPNETGQIKSSNLWDKQLQYRLVIHPDPKASFDGESFAQIKDGVKTLFVILNTAFLEKEGLHLFHRLSEKENAKSLDGASSLSRLETTVFLKDSTCRITRNDRSVRKMLELLQSRLERDAWEGAFWAALRQSSSRKEAEHRFVQYFEAVRKVSLEVHEVAHLIDLEEKGDDSSPEFDRYSELNAFYSELAYGSNPQDVLAQVLSGVVEEMSQGKSSDYSSTKVSTVLELLGKDPRFHEGFPKSSCGWTALTRVKKNAFVEAGRKLYQENLQAFASPSPSLVSSPSGE
jgi:hypothetical protein